MDFKYIKTNKGLIFIDEELAKIARKHRLKIYEGDLLEARMAHYDFGNDRYYRLMLCDMPNRNRIKMPTITELKNVENYFISKGFEVVEKLPDNQPLI